jgi:hypothetical protein
VGVHKQRGHGVVAKTPDSPRRAARVAQDVAARLSEPSALLWAVVVAGTVLRAARYLDNRSLWLDESLLGLNLISKSTTELLTSLDYVQSAPPGFLLAEKASIALFGEGEWALRLFPFLASLAALVLFAVVSRRLLRPGSALLAVTLFALNEPLLYQSSEAKPYSSDVIAALLVVWLSLRLLNGAGALIGIRDVLPLALVGVGVVWLSYPSVFVVASAGAAVLLRLGWSRTRRPLALLVPVGALWATSFLLVYRTSSETIAAVSGPIFGGGGHLGAIDVSRGMWYALADPGGFVGAAHALAALLLVVGVAGFAMRDRPERLVLVAGPAVLALVALFLGRYPLGGRFSLFLAPFVWILVARGFQEISKLVVNPIQRRLVLAAAALVLLAMPIADALTHSFDPPRGEHVRPLLQRLVREWRPGDTVYVFRNSQYAFRYYGDCRGCGVPEYPFSIEAPPGYVDNDGLGAALVTNAPSVIIGVPEDATGNTPNFKLLGDRERVWALFSHVNVGRDATEDDRLLDELEERGRRVGSWREPGAALYLYRIDD